MSNITVKSLPDKRPDPPARRSPGGAGCMAAAGIFMLLVSVGPLVILLNGGYSIIGMAWLANKIGPYGRMFWAVASYYTIEVPIAQRAGLPLSQPILPWLMVLGITFLEVSLILYRMRRANPGLWITGGAVVFSFFDYITTAAGLMFAPFTAQLGGLWTVWAVLAIIIAFPLTFGFEGLLARVLRGG